MTGRKGWIRLLGRTWVVAVLTSGAAAAMPWPGSAWSSATASAQEVASSPEVPAYELDLRLDPEGGRMTGRALVRPPPSAIVDGAVRLSLPATGGRTMTVDRVVGTSDRPLTHSTEEGVVTVRVGNGAVGTAIRLEYSVPVDETQLQPFGYYAFAPFGPGTWAYPLLHDARDTPYIFGDFAVTLDHPSSLTVITTGGTGQSEPRGDRTVARYEADHVQGFAIVAGEGFTVERTTAGSVPVVAFFHPDHSEPFAKVVEATGEAAAWYRRTYGFFPLDEVGIIQGHPRWGGGYPLPNLFAVHLGLLDDDFLTYITAHELGHYYWGLHVLGPGGNLDWLQLALGIWADQLYLAEQHGRSLSEQFRLGVGQGDWFADYLEAVVRNREQGLGLSAAEQSAQTFDYNSLVRHGKAATGVYLQSLLLGEDRFLELQREILESYRHRSLELDGFVARLEDAGLSGAGAFFDAWVRGDATVGLATENVWPADGDGGWRVALARTGTVPYPVEVEVAGAGGRTVRHIVPADVDRDTVEVAFEPAEVSIDPDGRIPMWNSSHPEIRSVYARALERGRLYEPFIALGQEVLRENPDDDYLRYRLVRRLHRSGRWHEAARLAPPGPGCDSRNECLAALYAVRAQARTGDRAGARVRLRALEAPAEQLGAGSLLATVREEVGG